MPRRRPVYAGGMKNRWLLSLAWLLLGVVAVGHAAAQSSTLKGDPAHPAHAQGWVDTRLYFGLGRVEAGSDEAVAGHSEARVTNAGWLEFLDKEVTPRFPDGLSVMDVYGQWQGKTMSKPERLRSKLLVIDFPDPGENQEK